MAKPCILDDLEFAEVLAQLPDSFLTTQDAFALVYVARNTLKESDRLSFKEVAAQVNLHFQDDKTKPLTAAKLGKLLKNYDDASETLVTDLEAALAEHAAREQASPRQPLPPWELPTRLTSHVNPALAMGTLAFMEFMAHIRGDATTAQTLASINQEVTGNSEYKNPLITVADIPGVVQQKISQRLERLEQRRQDVWGRLRHVADQANSVGQMIAARAQQDWKMVQVASYTHDSHQAADGGLDTNRQEMIALLKEAATRTSTKS